MRGITFLAGCALSLAALSAGAREHHHGAGAPAPATPPVFIASTAKPFGALMDDAMAVMDAGMRQAPMNGASEHDWRTAICRAVQSKLASRQAFY